MNDQPNKRKRLAKILAGSVLGLLLLYIGSYIPNSLAGGWMVNESGKCRPTGLASCDQFLWLPRYGFCQRFQWSGGRDGIRAGGLGYFYCPLVLLDQAYWHKTIRFLREEDNLFVEPFPVPPIEEYHPTMENPFAGRFPYQQATNETEETAEQSPAGDVANRAAPEE